MKYFTKRQQEILKYNKFEIIDNLSEFATVQHNHKKQTDRKHLRGRPKKCLKNKFVQGCHAEVKRRRLTLQSAFIHFLCRLLLFSAGAKRYRFAHPAGYFFALSLIINT